MLEAKATDAPGVLAVKRDDVDGSFDGVHGGDAALVAVHGAGLADVWFVWGVGGGDFGFHG